MDGVTQKEIRQESMINMLKKIHAAKENDFAKRQVVMLARDYQRPYRGARSVVGFRYMLPGDPYVKELMSSPDRETEKDLFFRIACIMAKHKSGSVSLPGFLRRRYWGADEKSSIRKRIEYMLAEEDLEDAMQEIYRNLNIAMAQGVNINIYGLGKDLIDWSFETRERWAGVIAGSSVIDDPDSDGNNNE